MSAKPKQRTKGNLKPSSSAKAAELLAASGHSGSSTIGFLGFEAFSSSSSVSAGPDDEGAVNDNAELDPDIRVAMRQLFKREPVTKVKALKVLEGLFADKDESALLIVVQCWPRLYNKLGVDNDYKVREAAHSALGTLSSRLQKQMGPHLRSFGATWLLAIHDPYPSVASVAREAFDNCFAEDKRSGVYGFCAKEILTLCANILIKQVPVPTKSGDSELAHEEQERHARLSLCALQLLSKTMHHLPEKVLVSQDTKQQLMDDIFDQSKIWKTYPVGGNLNVRAAFFEFLHVVVEKMPMYFSPEAPAVGQIADSNDSSPTAPAHGQISTIPDRMKKCAGAAISVLHNPKPVVLKPGITALLALARFDVFWSSVSMEKAFLPGLTKALSSGCNGCAYLLGPSLLVLVSRMPKMLVTGTPNVDLNENQTGGIPVGFDKIMRCLTEGCLLLLQSARSPVLETCSLLQAFCDCMRLAMTRNAVMSEDLKRELIKSVKSLLTHSISQSKSRSGPLQKIMAEILTVVLKSQDQYFTAGLTDVLDQEHILSGSNFENLVQIMNLVHGPCRSELNVTKNESSECSLDYPSPVQTFIQSIVSKSMRRLIEKISEKISDESLPRDDLSFSLFEPTGELYNWLEILSIWARYFPEVLISTMKSVDVDQQSRNNCVLNKSLVKFVATLVGIENNCNYAVLRTVFRLLFIEGLETSAQNGRLSPGLIDLIRIDNNFIPVGFQFVALCDELQNCACFHEYWNPFYRQLLESPEFGVLMNSGFENIVSVEIQGDNRFIDTLCDYFLKCLKNKDPMSSFKLSTQVTSEFCENLYSLFPTLEKPTGSLDSTAGSREKILNPKLAASRRFMKILIGFAEVVFDLSDSPDQYLLRRQLLSAMMKVHFVCFSFGNFGTSELMESVRKAWLTMFRRSITILPEMGNGVEHVSYTLVAVGELLQTELTKTAIFDETEHLSKKQDPKVSDSQLGEIKVDYNGEATKSIRFDNDPFDYWISVVDSALNLTKELDSKDSKVGRQKIFLVALCPNINEQLAIALADQTLARIGLESLIQNHRLPGFSLGCFDDCDLALNRANGTAASIDADADHEGGMQLLPDMAQCGRLAAFLLPKLCETIKFHHDLPMTAERAVGIDRDTNMIYDIIRKLHYFNGLAKSLQFRQSQLAGDSTCDFATSLAPSLDRLIHDCNSAFDQFYSVASDANRIHSFIAIMIESRLNGGLWLLALDDVLGFLKMSPESSTTVVVDQQLSIFKDALTGELNQIANNGDNCGRKRQISWRVLFVIYLHHATGPAWLEPLIRLIENDLRDCRTDEGEEHQDTTSSTVEPPHSWCGHVLSSMDGGLAMLACVHQLSSDQTERVLGLLMKCKDTKLLLASKLDEADAETIVFNINSLKIMIGSLEHFDSLGEESSDFILCSMIAWLQTATDSALNRAIDMHFVRHAVALFNALADHFKDTAGLVSSDPDENVPDNKLSSEWQDFFVKGASALLLVLLKRLKAGDPNRLEKLAINEIAHSLRFVSKEDTVEMALDDQLLSPDLDIVGYSEQMQSLLLTFLPLMQSGCFGQQIAAFHTISKLLEDIVPVERKIYALQSPVDSSTFHHQKKDTTERELPKYLLESLNTNYSLIESPLASSEFWEFADAPPALQTALVAYLLSFKLIVEYLRLTEIEERPLFSGSLLEDRQFECFMLTLFCILPENPQNLLTTNEKCSVNQEESANISKFPLELIRRKPKSTGSNFSRSKDLKSVFTILSRWPGAALTLPRTYVESLACNLLYDTMTTFPALVRQWWNNQNKRISVIVEKFVSQYVTGILCAEEFSSISNADRKEFDNLKIVVRPSVREVLATYVTEDMSMELVMRLAPNHPLGAIHVDSGKRVGVPKEQWRKWMLQLNVVLMHQNGSLLDGLQLWKSNVDKHLEGVEDCMICMMAVHGSNYSLPKILCKQCKKKFHAACLYKWFSSSENTTCPMCRCQF